MGSDLKAGLDTISLNQEITFTLYRKVVLPLDGFVYWVKAEVQDGGSALFNTSPLNTFGPNFTGGASDPAPTLKIMGSLHYATDQRQDQDASYAVDKVVFSAQDPVVDFNRVNSDELYIATFDGIRFAFNGRRSYYEQANLHHYYGDAIYSFMESQVVDIPALLNARALVVSNSLPAWLALNRYSAPYPIPLARAAFQLYPSYLAPNNLAPPYGTVDIGSESTEALSGEPFVNQLSSQYSPTREHVTITLYGCNNYLAGTFLLNVLQYAQDTARFGITNMPVIKDDKRTQSELSVIAMKKRIEFDVYYYQNVVRDIGRQLIEDASATVIAGDGLILSTDINTA